MLLFYVRHGDPIYDPDSLTPLGEKQAEALAKRLCRHGIDRIFASTSERAILTATPTANYVKKEITTMEWCHENNAWNIYAFPNEDGNMSWPAGSMYIKKLFLNPDVLALGQQWYEHPSVKEKHDYAPGIEGLNKHVDELIASLGYEHDRVNGTYRVTKPNNERVALFAHYGFGMGFLSSLLDIPYPVLCTHFDLCHSGMTVINFRNQGGVTVPQVLTLSNDSHIFAEGLPTKYNNEIFF